MKNWKEVYQLPLEYDGYNYAWAKNGTMTLMFRGLEESERLKVIEALNGKIDFKIEKLTYKGCDFFKDNEYVFCVRGWGNLTGVGGLNLPEDEALKIQDGFIDFVSTTLAKNKAKTPHS